MHIYIYSIHSLFIHLNDNLVKRSPRNFIVKEKISSLDNFHTPLLPFFRQMIFL